MKREPFVWNEIEHWTGQDLMMTVQLLTEDDVDDFMESYVAVCDDEDHAVHNIRYMLGIIGGEEAKEIAELFMVELPGVDEVLSPRHWWSGSSLGIKVA